MASLENDWKLLYSKTLPSLAVSKSPTQEVWPVHLDHCFARIILDNIIGIDRPWTSRLASPALKNMTHEQLEKCIALGKAIADGREDLTELDAISLEMRGKKQKSAAYSKRRRATRSPMDTVERSPKRRQLSIKNALSITSPSTILSPTSTTLLDLKPPDNPGHDLTTLITTSNLSSFRQKVLLALCQVPRGRFTTYAAISNHLHSSARAVGNGLRNNPFAPRVPCHRVVAADRSIGGFGGFWGKEGKFAGEKVRLLREEGVIVDAGKGMVEGNVWRGFISSDMRRCRTKQDPGGLDVGVVGHEHEA